MLNLKHVFGVTSVVGLAALPACGADGVNDSDPAAVHPETETAIGAIPRISAGMAPATDATPGGNLAPTGEPASQNSPIGIDTEPEATPSQAVPEPATEPSTEAATTEPAEPEIPLTGEPSPLAVGEPHIINFRPSDAPASEGSLSETGMVFGGRGAGWSYGFSTDHSQMGVFYAPIAELAPLYPSWSRIQLEAGATWEVAVPNGLYQVSLTAGGWTANTLNQHLLVEGVTIVNEEPGDYHVFVSGAEIVEVADGRLTLEGGELAEGNEIGTLGLTLLEERP